MSREIKILFLLHRFKGYHDGDLDYRIIKYVETLGLCTLYIIK